MTDVLGLDLSPLPPIVVYGTPAGQGSKKAVLPRGHHRPIVLEQHPEGHKAWRTSVKDAARDVLTGWAGGHPLVGPLAVAVVWTLKKPKMPAKRRVGGQLVPYVAYPATRPDVDKLERSVLDSLKDAGVYGDDGQVVCLVGTKAYPGEWPWSLEVPGCTILVRSHTALMADLLTTFAAGPGWADDAAPEPLMLDLR